MRTRLTSLSVVAIAQITTFACAHAGQVQSSLTAADVRAAFSHPSQEAAPPQCMLLSEKAVRTGIITHDMLSNQCVRGYEFPDPRASDRLPAPTAPKPSASGVAVVTSPPATAPVVEPPSAGTKSSCSAGECTVMIEFQTGSYRLNDQAMADLMFIRGVLLQETKPLMLRIEGHADTVGSVGTNELLSANRARAAALVLTMNSGVDVHRMQVYFLGKDPRYLIVQTPDQTPEARNRCVRIVLASVGP